MTTCVFYVYYETEFAKLNLDFFLRNGINDETRFIIIINGFHCSLNLPNKNNVTIIKRENIGFDFGGFGAGLEYLVDEYKSINNFPFTYYIFINSSVTGPFVPSYFNKCWTTAFTDKINENVKLVGTSIVCLPSTDLGGYGPKVEGFCFSTDKIGLEILLNEETIFINHENKTKAIVDGEYGLSRAILNNGYNIDCLLYRYKNINWQDKNNWNLNNNIHPSREKSYFGISIHPFEVIFHKWYWSYQPDKKVSYDFTKKYMEWY